MHAKLDDRKATTLGGLISICIPAYCRPKLLQITLDSILAQDYPELEIIIGDDSPDNDSENVVAKFRERTSMPIRYFHNKPSKGQNDNVNQLFAHAMGDRLILLHDDDTLLPGAISKLAAAWDNEVHLAFGMQKVIDDAGRHLEERSIQLNTDYARTAEYAGRQKHALASAFLQQIPNDGFLVSSAYARAVGYRSHAEVGVYCDLDFNIRLAESLPPSSVVILSEYISEYRISADAISTSTESRNYEHPRAALAAYTYTRRLHISREVEQSRDVLLSRLAANALKGYANAGMKLSALRIYFSPYMPKYQRSGARGIYHFLYIIYPPLARRLRALS